MKLFLLIVLFPIVGFAGPEFLDSHYTVAAYVHAIGEQKQTNGVEHYFGKIPKDLFPKINEARLFMAKPRYTFEEAESNPIINRDYTVDYLKYLYSRLKEGMGQEPNAEDVFFAYAIGFEAYKKIDYDFEKITDKDIQMRFKWFQKFIEIPELVTEAAPPLNTPREILGEGDGRVPTRTFRQRQMR